MSERTQTPTAEETPVVKVVFFGDSITASNRNLLDPEDLGVGYVKIAAGKLRLLYPDTAFQFVNRGVDGDRTAELLQRVKKDVVDENPDYVVLEVGINDVWCRFSRGEEVTPEAFRANYLQLVDTILATGAKLFLIQPYALKMGDKQRFLHIEIFRKSIEQVQNQFALAAERLRNPAHLFQRLHRNYSAAGASSVAAASASWAAAAAAASARLASIALAFFSLVSFS